MAIEVFNRYEHKYMLDKDTFEKVIAVMNAYMDLDSHSAGHIPYTIANIYFDTIENGMPSQDFDSMHRQKMHEGNNPPRVCGGCNRSRSKTGYAKKQGQFTGRK